MKLLVDANANPELPCNLGDTPSSVAYGNNHTALSDWLENVTSSTKDSASVELGVSQRPLFSEITRGKGVCPE